MFHDFRFGAIWDSFFGVVFGLGGFILTNVSCFLHPCSVFVFPVSFLGVVFDLGGLILTHVSCFLASGLRVSVSFLVSGV